MSSDLQTGSGATATELVSGIITDAQDLMKQQLALFRSEVREDVRKTKEAAVLLMGGLAVVQIAAIILSLMLVHLLIATTPNMLPPWACYGIVGGGLALLGGGLTMMARSKFSSFNPLPDQSAQAVKENVRWMTNPK
jgi:uncharacterized membrane protein YqjE